MDNAEMLARLDKAILAIDALLQALADAEPAAPRCAASIGPSETAWGTDD
jgi:hypothetical protein